MPGPSNSKRKAAKKTKQKKKQVPRDTKETEVVVERPFIDDPGNGPRVRDAKRFMNSYFAQPASMEDELCREFAQEEMLEMLKRVLPEEMALIVWYNKSRLKSRVCPACQRLYSVGDIVQDVVERTGISIEQEREQGLSGLCSPVCFVVACYDFPGGMKGAWGRRGQEISDSSWEGLMEGAECGNTLSRVLGLVVKMTRLDDLGLQQLLF